MPKLIAFLALLTLILAPSATANEISERQYWLGDYGFKEAWKYSQGEGVLVAVIDTGIDSSHPTLQGAVVGGTDVSGLGSSDGQKPVGESSYHGTMVASLLAGRGPDYLGIAPKASLLSVSMAFGAGSLDTDTQVAEAVIWAVDNGARVINLSLTRNSTDWPKSWDRAFTYAFENDVVVVAAVGNKIEGTGAISAPAAIPGVIAVAGVDRDKKPSRDYSVSGFQIAVAAPAEELIAAYPGGEFRLWSGSSGAAPIVSGLATLIRSKYPDMDANNVINRIIKTANQPGFEVYSSSLGYGLIDPEAALTANLDLVQQNPLGSLEDWIQEYRGEEEIALSLESPFESSPVEILPAPTLTSQTWLPIAGYAGVGLLAIFLFYAFLPKPAKPARKI
jgi:type VII secretion-associated serine protease mycosin